MVRVRWEPQREKLLLADPAVKYFWGFNENFAIRGGVLKFKWMSGIDRCVVYLGFLNIHILCAGGD